MDRKEMAQYLESIGGLVNGYYPNREPMYKNGLFECGEGWNLLIKDTINELITLGWDKHTYQIKEKFGTLRIYIGNATDEMHNIISKAEIKSAYICEECGEPGELKYDGWIETLCEKHYKK